MQKAGIRLRLVIALMLKDNKQKLLVEILMLKVQEQLLQEIMHLTQRELIQLQVMKERMLKVKVLSHRTFAPMPKVLRRHHPNGELIPKEYVPLHMVQHRMSKEDQAINNLLL